MSSPSIISPVGGALTDRIGARSLAIGGAAAAGAGLAWMALFVGDEEYAILVPGFVVFGMGIPIAFASLLTAGAGAAPAQERGAAAGVLNGARWIGATVGTVAFGAVLSAVRESKLDDSLAGDSLSTEQARQVDHLVLADEDARSVAVNDLGQRVVDAVGDAFASGYGAGLWLCAAMLALAAIVAAWTLRSSS